MSELADLATGYTGADLGGLVREASVQALKDVLMAAETAISTDASDAEYQVFVEKRHFLEALAKIKPSVSNEVI